jgi:ABC-type lipoprotein export system ATPase subunit
MKKREVNLSTNRFIVITGLTRSGKTALTPLISSMKNCEQFFFNTIV